MSYTTRTGLYVNSEDVTLASPAAHTASGTGDAVELGPFTTLRLVVTTSAVSGTTPTLDLTVETSHDGSTWRSHGTLAQITATGTQRKSFGGLDRYARLAWTVGGTTPSFTFGVTAEAQ